MGAAKRPAAAQKPVDADLPDEIDFSGGIRGRRGPRQVTALLRHQRGVGVGAKNGTNRAGSGAMNDVTTQSPAPTTQQLSGVTDWSLLVGKFFHTFSDGRIARQGVFLADLCDGYFVVGHFEWATGHPSFHGTRVVHISTVASDAWALYPDAETMREAYKYGGAAPKG